MTQVIDQAKAAQRSRWARFLDSILPPANPNRLVPVAEVSRESVPFLEGCFADAEIYAMVREVPGPWGTESRFEVLVPARDREVASEVVAGF